MSSWLCVQLIPVEKKNTKYNLVETLNNGNNDKILCFELCSIFSNISQETTTADTFTKYRTKIYTRSPGFVKCLQIYFSRFKTSRGLWKSFIKGQDCILTWEVLSELFLVSFLLITDARWNWYSLNSWDLPLLHLKTSVLCLYSLQYLSEY